METVKVVCKRCCLTQPLANSPEAAEIYDAIKTSDRFQSTVKIGNAPACRIRDKAFFEL